MSRDRAVSTDPLDSGWLCLDFVNTVDLRLSVHDEALHTYADLVQWAHEHDVLDAANAQRLLATAEHRPHDAARSFARARALREALFGVVHALLHNEQVAVPELELVNEVLADHAVPVRLVGDATGMQPTWLDHHDRLDWILGPISRSAVTLLTAPEELARVRECPGSPGKACGWLFVDRTKNRNRQWCVGGRCGNRTRAHRHYDRRHAAQPGRTAK